MNSARQRKMRPLTEWEKSPTSASSLSEREFASESEPRSTRTCSQVQTTMPDLSYRWLFASLFSPIVNERRACRRDLERTGVGPRGALVNLVI
jgi:hypothetical protein